MYLPRVACLNCGQTRLSLQSETTAACARCGAERQFGGPICPQCELVNAPGAELCAGCRATLVLICPECDTRHWSAAEACTNCGHRFDTLGSLIDRVQPASEIHRHRQRELAAFKAEEEASSERRMAALMDIDRRRLESIGLARRRKAEEERLVLMVGAAIVVLIIVGVIAAVVFNAPGA